MGIIIGLINALTVSIQNRQLRVLADVNTLFLNWLRFSSAAIIVALLVALFGLWQIPTKETAFLIAIIIALEGTIGFLYVRAFQLSPQSIVGPLFGLTALFLIPLGFLVLGEAASILGIAGVVIVIVGTLVLGWNLKDPGMLQSLRHLFREKGTYYMLGVAFLASVIIVTVKLTFNDLPPLTTAFYVLVGLSIVYAPSLVYYPAKKVRAHWKSMLLMMLMAGAGSALHYTGISLLFVAYYISLKRVSIVFDVIIGHFVGEQGFFKLKLAGALLIFLGVVVIALA